jgi:hypothetical protein
MKRFHEYEKETTETYYALGKGNKFLKAFDMMEEEICLCKEPKDAYTFVRYDKAKQFLIEYSQDSRMFDGFKIYAITHVVKTETHYTVLDCDIYKETQKRIAVAQ